MMRLSTRGRYGLHAMYHLGCNYGKDPISLNEIAKKTGLSENYLEQLLRQLKKSGLIDSVRGAQGGYLLSRPASEITIGEILISTEEFFGPSECAIIDGLCSRQGNCPARGVWMDLYDSMLSSVNKISLQEMIEGQYIL